MEHRREQEYVNGNFDAYLKRTTKGAGFVFGIRIFSVALSFLTGVVFARILGADLYGVFQLGLTVVTTLMLFSNFGMSAGLVRYIPIYEDLKDRSSIKSIISFAFILGISISFCLGLLLFLFRNFVANNIFHEPRLAGILPVFSVILIFYSLIIILGGVIQANKKYHIFVLYRDICERLFSLTFFLLFYFLTGEKLFGITWAKFLTAIIIFVLVARWVIKRYPYILKPPYFPRSRRREFLLYSSNLLFISFTYFLMGQVNRLLIGAYTESKQVGYYSVGTIIAGIVVFVLTSFNSIFAPIISELYHRKDFDTLSKMYSTITRLIWVFTLPIFLWIVLFADRILLFFGPDFVAAKWILIFLAIGQFVNAAVGPNGLMLSMSGHQKWEMFNGVAIATLNLVLNILLIPRFGALGSAIGGAAALTAVNITKSVEVWFVMKMIPYNRKYIKPVISGVLGAGVLYLLRTVLDVNIFATLFAGLVGGIVVLGTGVLLGLEKEDKMLLKALLRRINRR